MSSVWFLLLWPMTGWCLAFVSQTRLGMAHDLESTFVNLFLGGIVGPAGVLFFLVRMPLPNSWIERRKRLPPWFKSLAGIPDDGRD